MLIIKIGHLVTGPTGHGKSTTLAAIIDEIANTRACHIVTIEDPVEFVFGSKKALVSQRELGQDTYTILVPEDQLGKVIGKEGKVINSIRHLARLKAIKTKQRILLKVNKISFQQ